MVGLSGVFSFLIAHCFVTVFEMTVDTIFICFCDDITENDGVQRPYFMSPELMDVMKKLKAETGGEFNFGNKDPYHDTPNQSLPVYPVNSPSFYPQHGVQYNSNQQVQQPFFKNNA